MERERKKKTFPIMVSAVFEWWQLHRCFNMVRQDICLHFAPRYRSVWNSNKYNTSPY